MEPFLYEISLSLLSY